MFPFASVRVSLLCILAAALMMVGFSPLDVDACCGRFGFGGRIAQRRAERRESRGVARVGLFRARSACADGSCGGDWSSAQNGCMGAQCGTAEVQAQPPVK